MQPLDCDIISVSENDQRKALDMGNKIETSTANIGHFVYRGTYETYYGEYLGCVPRDKREECEEECGKLAVDMIGEKLWGILPSDVNDDFELEYIGTYHPRYYNFETDSVLFSFEYSDDLKSWMLDYVMENLGYFKTYLKDHYTSRDGFISFTANNFDDWKEGWEENDQRCVSAMLRFLIEQELGVSDIEHCSYDFDEEATTIIGEQYISWEYAVKFDNGFVAVVKGDWDDEEQACVYNAWLLDVDGKIVNTAKTFDAYDDDFHGSAYAAWEYSCLEYDLTKKHTLCDIHSVPCDVHCMEVC